MENDFWELNADNWTKTVKTGAIASRRITNKAILEAVLLNSPSSILDVGCGEGWLAWQTSARGIRYVGIDGSQNLIETAKKTQHGSFFHVNYEQILKNEWMLEEKVDCICFNFSLFDESLFLLLTRMATFLNHEGRIVIQTLHPFSLAPYENGWRKEDFKTIEVPFQGEMLWYGRTFAGWTKEFAQAGLRIDKIIEPSDGIKPVSVIFVLVEVI